MSVSPKSGITDLDNFIGAAPTYDGTRGQVPTPVIGDETKFLRGDGTWAAVTATGGGSGTVTYLDVAGGDTGLVFSGGPVTASGIITASGTVAVTAGGTGKSSYTAGDLIYASATTTLTSRNIGASGQVLTASNGVPVWAAVPTSTTAASATSSYVIMGSDASLSQARGLTASTGITITDGGAGSGVYVAVTSQIVAGGPVGSASVVPVITYNGQGQLTTVTTAAITPSAIGAVPTSRNVYASGALTGGGDLSADITLALASIVGGFTVGSSGAIPVITFDNYGRITSATSAVPPTSSGGSGTTVYTAQGTVDFGFASGEEGGDATVTISATWVMATSYIVCSPYAVATADHDADDYMVEGITAYAANLSSGVGFDIVAFAPNNTWGRYTINAQGI